MPQAPPTESKAASAYQPPKTIATHLGTIVELLPKATVIPGAHVKEVFLAYVPTQGKPAEVLFYETTHLDLDTDGSTESWEGVATEGKTHQGKVSLDGHLKDGQFTDSNLVPYFVLPGLKDKKGYVGSDHHVQLGDVGVIIGPADQKKPGGPSKVVFAQFADTGPHSKLGEASLAVHRAFGQEDLKGRKKVRDCDMTGPFVTIVFPGSGSAKPRMTAAEIEKKAKELFLAIGGKL